MPHVGYPDYVLMTAHAAALETVGQITDHVVEYANFSGNCGVWELQYVRAMGSVTQGQIVCNYQLAITDVDSGSTTTATEAAGFPATADLLVGGLMHVDVDAAGAGGVPEGEYSWITDSNTNTITFSPALTTAIAANDDISVNVPFGAVQGTVTGYQSVLGLALATATVGQYFFVLRKGFYPTATVVSGATTSWSVGVGLIPGAAGILTPHDAAFFPWQSPCAFAIQRKLAGDLSTTHPVMMTVQ